VKKEAFEEEKNEYYEAVGWDKNGLPKPAETLRKLGLQDVEAKLRKTNILH
jgi:aldehyde:ferredoxin oxidoreductase